MKIQISLITIDNRKVETIALIDSGAKGANYISRSFAIRKKIPLKILKKSIPILNVDGTENEGGHIREYAQVEMKIQDQSCESRLLVTSLGQETVILGYPWLRQENPDINWKSQTLTWRKENPY